MNVGHGGRSRNMARGAETISGGWQVASEGNIQVDGIFSGEEMGIEFDR